ncbi:hypothetical protein V6N12_004958 [Hibiscus sabdariffa]|uniref:Uncharacterized protein n=1 Tax=Hibiscus sabdariffa TaxID=183260 RepID=A0ABR2CN26_9ROSI
MNTKSPTSSVNSNWKTISSWKGGDARNPESYDNLMVLILIFSWESRTGFPRDNGVRILTNNSTRNNGPLMAKKTLVFFPNIPNQITRSPTLTFTAAAAA